jgi:hypothetical protein
VKPAVVHPKPDTHSGEAPADLVDPSTLRRSKRAANARGGGNNEGTLTRGEYYRLLGLPVPT